MFTASAKSLEENHPNFKDMMLDSNRIILNDNLLITLIKFYFTLTLSITEFAANFTIFGLI